MKASDKDRRERDGATREMPISVDTFEDARNLVLNFPAAKDFGGFSFAQTGRTWEAVIGRGVGGSKLGGKIIGRKTALPGGGTALYRIDWEPPGPMVDAAGKPVMVPLLDDNMKPVLDHKGKPRMTQRMGKGAHINVEFLKVPDVNGKKYNYKAAVLFKCKGGKDCTEEEILKLLKGNLPSHIKVPDNYQD